MRLNQHFFTNPEERTEFVASLLVLILAGLFIGYMIWPSESLVENVKHPEVSTVEVVPPVEEVVDKPIIDEPAKPSLHSVERNDEILTQATSPKIESKTVTPPLDQKQDLEIPKLETLTRSDGAKTLPDYVEPEPNALLVVHSFGIERNALNFAERLRKDGYTTEIRRQKNGWHSVGVPFNDEVVNMDGLRQALSQEYDAQPKLWANLSK